MLTKKKPPHHCGITSSRVTDITVYIICYIAQGIIIIITLYRVYTQTHRICSLCIYLTSPYYPCIYTHTSTRHKPFIIILYYIGTGCILTALSPANNFISWWIVFWKYDFLFFFSTLSRPKGKHIQYFPMVCRCIQSK